MKNILHIMNRLAFGLFLISGWILAMFGLFAFAFYGTLGLMNMSVQIGLPADTELAGPMMVVLFVTGFVCLNQVTGGALYRVMGWSNDE